MRDALGPKPGQTLEIRADDGRLQIAVATTPMQLTTVGKGIAAVPDGRLPALTSELVRKTLERSRR